MFTPGASHHLRGDSMSPPPPAVKPFLTLLSLWQKCRLQPQICTSIGTPGRVQSEEVAALRSQWVADLIRIRSQDPPWQSRLSPIRHPYRKCRLLGHADSCYCGPLISLVNKY